MKLTGTDTITIYRGDTPTIQDTVYDYTGTVAFNLSGYTVQLLVKKDKDTKDADAQLTKDGSVTDAANGVVQFSLTESDTALSEGNYMYDIQIKDGTNLFTTNKGVFVVTRDIRRAGN